MVKRAAKKLGLSYPRIGAFSTTMATARKRAGIRDHDVERAQAEYEATFQKIVFPGAYRAATAPVAEPPEPEPKRGFWQFLVNLWRK